MLDRLLSYWRSLEYFQPSWPVEEKKTNYINLSKGGLPWPLANPDPDLQISYGVYTGCGVPNGLIKWMLDRLGLEEDNPPIELDTSKCCLWLR
jgi:hypothetical protein